jgi:hypothetical protein
MDPIQSTFELHFELHEPRKIFAAVTQNGIFKLINEHCAFELQGTHILF